MGWLDAWCSGYEGKKQQLVAQLHVILLYHHVSMNPFCSAVVWSRLFWWITRMLTKLNSWSLVDVELFCCGSHCWNTLSSSLTISHTVFKKHLKNKAWLLQWLQARLIYFLLSYLSCWLIRTDLCLCLLIFAHFHTSLLTITLSSALPFLHTWWTIMLFCKSRHVRKALVFYFHGSILLVKWFKLNKHNCAKVHNFGAGTVFLGFPFSWL